MGRSRRSAGRSLTMLVVRPYKAQDEAPLIELWKICNLTRPWNDPDRDISLATTAPNATLLVAVDDDDVVIGSVMAGFDGHRGWLYYLAVHPDHRVAGHGRTLCAHAEAWLKTLGCPKVEALMRAENNKVRGFYDSIGYRFEDRVLMAKWLIPQPVANLPDDTAAPDLPVVVTYLELTEPPTTAPLRPPILDLPLSLLRVENPSVAFYRYLYHTVGEEWFWWLRRALPDEQLLTAITAETTELSVLYIGGQPAGYVELNAAPMPKEMEIAYFGLLPNFTGRGIGPYLLDWAIHAAWNRDPKPGRLILNTCTADHPKALQTYQRAGFEPYRQEHLSWPDPRLAGLIPKHLPYRMPDGTVHRLDDA